MKGKPVLAILIVAGCAQAGGPRFYERGKVTEMDAVECSYEDKGSPGIASALLGTEDERGKSEKMFCQEYVLSTDRVVYKIRPKDEKHPRPLPVGTEAEFRIDKDHMYLRIRELENKERQYVVTSMVPRGKTSSR